MIQAWFIAFVATVIIELAIVGSGTRELGLPLRRRLLVAFLGQALTHPLVWFVFPELSGNGEVWFWVSELTAVGVEGALYAWLLPGLGPLGAFGLSALANAASLGAGVAANAVLSRADS